MARKPRKQPADEARLQRLDRAVGDVHSANFDRHDHIRTILEMLGDQRALALHAKKR